MLDPWKKGYDQPRQHVKKQTQKQTHYVANKDPSSQSYCFTSSHVWMWELDYKESWALKNWCFWTAVLEKTLSESLGLQGDPTSPPWRRSVLSVHQKDWCWSWNSNTLTTWWEELTHWKRLWCWERLKVGGGGDNEREWDGWMASPTPGDHSNSCPLSRWCHPAISSSVVPSPPAPNPSQHQSLFQWVNSSHEVAKVLEFQP